MDFGKVIHKRKLSLDEAIEYLTAEGKRKEELEKKMNSTK